MIKLFITDIDGCLSKPFEAPDWDLLTEIRSLNEQSRTNQSIPPLTLCTGRPQPYAEAVAQWLDIRLPIIFESSGLYYLKDNKVFLPDAFNNKVKNQIAELQLWMRKEVIPQYPGMELEFAKQMDAGLIHPEKSVIDEAYAQIYAHVTKNYPSFEVHKTPVSINTLVTGNNKKKGMQILCKELGIKLSEAAYVGDSSGDISALKIVGHAFAPAYAPDNVKEGSQVLNFSETEVVLKLYERLIAMNERVPGVP